MPLCVKCNREVCNPCVRPPPGRGHWRKIVVAADHELMNRAYFSRLAMATAALKEELGLSRRSIPDWMADVIYGHEGEIVWPGGKAFIVSDTAIDDAFGGDGSFSVVGSVYPLRGKTATRGAANSSTGSVTVNRSGVSGREARCGREVLRNSRVLCRQFSWRGRHLLLVNIGSYLVAISAYLTDSLSTKCAQIKVHCHDFPLRFFGTTGS